MIKPFRKIPLLMPIVLCAGMQVSAQVVATSTKSLPAKSYTVLNQKAVPLSKILSRLESHYKINLNYDSELLTKVTADEELLKGFSGDASRDLNKILVPHSLRAEKIEKNTYLILPAIENTVKPETKSIEKTRAQTATTVSGEVTDEEGVGLPGVTVVLKNATGVGVSTDVNGEYSLNLPAGQENGVLVFSFIGFETQEVPINNRAVINVTMTTDAKALEEVVVVGYGTQQRASVTGAVDQVTSAVIEGKPAVNVTQALQGYRRTSRFNKEVMSRARQPASTSGALVPLATTARWW